ncbi:hypothetical protein KAH94_03805 [bacterium]|nr:hypothetical protein [bacterium]
MVKSVRFKNIVIFSLSFFPFFGSFAFGMKRFFNLFCCCGFKEKNPEKYLGGVDINELPYDCMTEVISFLKQKEALGLRSVNRFFAKLVYRSPTVKKNMIFRKGKAFESFSKRVLPQNISFLLNLQKLTLKFWQECDSLGINKLNFPSSKLKNLKVLRYDNFGKKEIVFPPLLKRLSVSFCKKFGFNKVVFPPLLKELKVFRSESFGSKEIVFPRGLKNLGVYNCESFGKNKIVYPVSLKYLDVRVD